MSLTSCGTNIAPGEAFGHNTYISEDSSCSATGFMVSLAPRFGRRTTLAVPKEGVKKKKKYIERMWLVRALIRFYEIKTDAPRVRG